MEGVLALLQSGLEEVMARLVNNLMIKIYTRNATHLNLTAYLKHNHGV